MLYRVLGTLDVGGERPVRVPGGHVRTVFLALLLRANHPVSSTELLRVAWGDSEAPRVQLDKRIGEIRTLLDAVGRRDQLETVRGFGYVLRAREDELDALRFARLTVRAEEAKAAGDGDGEIRLLRTALGLWQGPHVGSNVDNELLAASSRGLEDRRRRVAVRLAELEFARRGHDRVLPELSGLVAEYPTDRRLCELLMIAQYRCGDRAAANVTYRTYEQALDREMGTRPEKSVRDLNYAIASGDEQAIARLEAAMGAPVTDRSVKRTMPRQLPAPLPDFVGREQSVAEAVWLLRRTQRPAPPVLVVAGAGGMGKTSLAQYIAHQVADSYPDGQVVAELRGSTDRPADPDNILADILRSLGVGRVPEASADRVRMYRTLVADRRLLLVLDDVRDEEQVRDLIPGGAGCAVIVTARRLLPDVDGVHHLPTVTELDPAEATALFLAVVHGSRIELSATDAAVEQAVYLCAGLPLALRVAASQYVRDYPLPIAELVERLARQGTDAIEYGPRSVSRSVGAGFERLDGPARQLFLCLGLTHLVDFEIWTAAAVLDGTGTDPERALSQLVEYHMVEPAGAARRYRFHDLTRDFAGRLADREVAQADRGRILTQAYGGLLSLARIAHRCVNGGDFEIVHSPSPQWSPPMGVAVPGSVMQARDWFERERGNIRASVAHCADIGLTDVCWDLAFTAHEFYALARHFDDWLTTHTIALQACQAVADGRGEAVMLVGLGQPILVASRPGSGVSGPNQLERAIDLLASSGDRHGLAIAERTLGNALRRRGQLDAPLRLFSRAFDNYEHSGDPLGRWQALRFLGHTHLDRGDIPAALRDFERAQAVVRELGRADALALTGYWLGQAQLAANSADAAAAAFQDLFDAFDGATGTGHAYAVHARGQLTLTRGDLRAAVAHLRQAATLAAEVADATLEGRVQLTLATAYDRMGLHDQRIAALEHAAECFAGGDAVFLQATALATLADALVSAGDQGEAEAVRNHVERLYDLMRLPDADRVHRGQIPPSSG